MRSALLDTTALSQPIPTPPGLPDARQRAHLAELAAVEKTLRQLPRVGATFTALGLRLRAQVLLQISTMTEDEERVYLDEQRDLWAQFEADEAA